MSSSNKKKAAATATAVALAAALMVGGTFAYITASSEEEVVNTFTLTDNISVDVSEDVDNEFDILPGTTDEKDPVVTLTSTVSSFVYLLVADTTDGAVLYEIADGWTLLYDADDEDNIYEGYAVYYRLADSTEGEETEYQVLANDQVTYATWVTSDDISDDGVTLSFKALAIQSSPFTDDGDLTEAEAAKLALSAYNTPQAKVTQVTPYEVTISNSSSSSDIVGSVTPDVIYVFEATDTEEEAAASYYAKWVADFVVTFDTDGADETELASWNQMVALAGQYDYYSEDYWIPIVLTGVEGGSSYNLLQTLFGSSSWGGVDYLELCGIIGTFTCGTVQNTSLGGYTIAVPDGVVMTVELRLMESYDEGADYISIGSWSYTFGS